MVTKNKKFNILIFNFLYYYKFLFGEWKEHTQAYSWLCVQGSLLVVPRISNIKLCSAQYETKAFSSVLSLWPIKKSNFLFCLFMKLLLIKYKSKNCESQPILAELFTTNSTVR